MADDRRVEDLEFRLAHLEKALQELSDALYDQQRQLDVVLARARTLTERLDALQDAPAPGAGPPEKPPHY